MRVIATPSDNMGCAYWRLEVPINAVMAQDPAIRVEALEREHLTTRRNARTGTDTLIGLDPCVLDADVFILQRPMIALQLELLRVLKLAGVAVIVEVDDDLHAMHKANSAARIVKSHHLATLKVCCEEADLVTVTTEPLAARYARHGRYAILPNCVPESWLDIAAEKEGNVVGWSGTVATHPKDLQTTLGGVGRAVAELDARFRVIGRSELVQSHLGLSHEPELAPWVPVTDYPNELAKLDVGIAPLTNSPFNRSKSWLKPLEMAACGVPVAMADVGEYRKLADYGIGALCSDSSDWQWSVSQLLKDEDLRASVARQQRQKVRELGLTIEANAHRWADAWKQALINRT